MAKGIYSRVICVALVLCILGAGLLALPVATQEAEVDFSPFFCIDRQQEEEDG